FATQITILFPAVALSLVPHGADRATHIFSTISLMSPAHPPDDLPFAPNCHSGPAPASAPSASATRPEVTWKHLPAIGNPAKLPTCPDHPFLMSVPPLSG